MTVFGRMGPPRHPRSRTRSQRSGEGGRAGNRYAVHGPRGKLQSFLSEFKVQNPPWERLAPSVSDASSNAPQTQVVAWQRSPRDAVALTV